MRVHISFYHEDRNWARAIAQRLRAIGVEPCFDSILTACGDVTDGNYSRISDKLSTYDYMIALVSDGYLSNEWMLKELFGALSYQQSIGANFVIALRINDTVLPPFYPPAIDLNEDCFDHAFNEVVTKLSGLKQMFVIMKLGDRGLDDVYEFVIGEVAKEFGLVAHRIDEVEDSGSISTQILKGIERSSVVLAELTGERPNCYYEAGYAHAKGKPLILCARDAENVHFDLRDRRVIFWTDGKSLREKLRSRLASMKAKSLI